MTKPYGKKKYHMLYIETGIQKVAEVMFRFPDKEFSLSDLAKEAGVAKANTGKILGELHRMGFVEITKLTKIWRIKAKQGEWNFRKAKIVYNLNSIHQSGLAEFLNEFYGNPKAIVLFGSFRQGEDISSSDIDIAIETDETDAYKAESSRQLNEFEKILGRKIQLHLFNRKNIDINVFNNIANGIVLSGFLEVKP